MHPFVSGPAVLDPSPSSAHGGDDDDLIRRLYREADDYAKNAALILLHTSQEHAGDPAVSNFLNRAMLALSRLIELSDLQSIRSSVTATNDVMVLCRALDNPEFLNKLARKDPLTVPEIRGTLTRTWILSEEGGAVSGADFAELAGVSRQTIDNRRNAGSLLALPNDNKRGFLYPIWQLRDGTFLPGLDRVLAELEDFGPWPKAQFMLEPNKWLDWDTPLNALRNNRIDSAVEAAAAFAQ